MDRLIKLDGEVIISGAFLNSYLSKHGERSIDVTVERNGKEVTLPIHPRTKEGETSPRFGFAYDFQYKTERVHYNPVDEANLRHAGETVDYADWTAHVLHFNVGVFVNERVERHLHVTSILDCIE